MGVLRGIARCCSVPNTIKLRAAFQVFQAAREELSTALSFKARLKDPAKKIEKSANAFLDFIKQRNEKRQRFESKEFKDFTASELNWEALTTVERLGWLQ